MSIDTTLIGETAAQLMETMPDETEGEIVAVGLVVIVDEGNVSYTRIRSSCQRHHEQVGLFHSALRGLTDGERWDAEDEAE